MTKYKIVLHLKEPTHVITYWRTKYAEAKNLSEAKIKARKLLVKQSEKENKVFNKAHIFTRNYKRKFEIISGTVFVTQGEVLKESKGGIKEWRLR